MNKTFLVIYIAFSYYITDFMVSCEAGAAKPWKCEETVLADSSLCVFVRTDGQVPNGPKQMDKSGFTAGYARI